MNNAKIQLNPAQIGKVKTGREALANGLAGGDKIRRRVEALATRRDEISDALERRLDPLDLEQIKNRGSLREQLAAIKKELDGLDADELSKAAVEANAAALVLICDLLTPKFESFVDRIAEILAPFYDDNARARQAALGTDAATVFRGNLSLVQTRQRDPSIASCQETVRFLDALLSGKNPWCGTYEAFRSQRAVGGIVPLVCGAAGGNAGRPVLAVTVPRKFLSHPEMP